MCIIQLVQLLQLENFSNIPLNIILDAVKSFEGVPGRIEHLFNYNGMDVILDYGHNPAGIETVVRH